MVYYVEVTSEQVLAARLEVAFFKAAGLEPDPMVARLADAQTRTTVTNASDDNAL